MHKSEVLSSLNLQKERRIFKNMLCTVRYILALVCSGKKSCHGAGCRKDNTHAAMRVTPEQIESARQILQANYEYGISRRYQPEYHKECKKQI